MPAEAGIQPREYAIRPYKNSWIPGRASYRQLARNDDPIMLRISEPVH